MKFLEGLSRKQSRSSGDEKTRLCIACETLSLRRLLEFGPSLRAKDILHPLSLSVIKSQRRSCEFCALLFQAIEAVCDSVCGDHDRKVVAVGISSHAKHQLKVMIEGTHRLNISMSGREAYTQKRFEQSFYLQEIFNDLSFDAFKRALIDKRPIEYQEVKQWLHDCREMHGMECHPATNFGFVTRPKRLVVVDVYQMCLVDLPADAKYAALSYVWGGVQLLHLNQGNSKSLRQPGSLAATRCAGDLPATICDAMEVTREIGLQYLWIDSLCIQQDEPCEAAYQVANMHNIYGSAYVAIVAAGGTSAKSGLLGTSSRPRELQYGLSLAQCDSNRPIVRCVGPGLSLGLVALATRRLRWDRSETDKWNIARHEALPKHTSIMASTWNHRAWTLQESLLSSRALVFIDGQVFWHCNKSMWCEQILGRKLTGSGRAVDARYSRLENLTGNPHFQESWKKYDASIEVKRDGRSLVVSSEAYLLYKDIVISYTPRAIGRLDDRLAAFDGIGNVVQQCLDTPFLYGLPESLLDAALLWHAKTSITLIQQEISTFPSWSWCGWEGGVKYTPQYGIERHQPRELHEHESAEERIRPLVRWYKTSEDGCFEPINDKGIGIKEALGDSGYLPDDWEGVLAPSMSRNIDIDVRSSSAQLLRCYTMTVTLPIKAISMPRLREELAFDRSDEDQLFHTPSPIENYYRIYSPKGNSVIGELVLDDRRTCAVRRGGDTGKREVDLITLSETQFFRSHELNLESRGNLYEKPFAYTLYNVMAVTWSSDGQTAYRRGLGRVFQDEWGKAGSELRWVNLG